MRRTSWAALFLVCAAAFVTFAAAPEAKAAGTISPLIPCRTASSFLAARTSWLWTPTAKLLATSPT